MSALATEVLREVSEAGGTVRLEGEMLRLRAPEPLPDELRARLHQHKVEIVALLSAAEPANDAAPVVQSVGGLPREIADGVHAILSAGHGSNAMWCGCAKAAGRGRRSRSAGPRPTCSAATARAPWHRLDRAGLVLLTGGHEIAALTGDNAALRTSTGSVLRYRRRPPAIPPVGLLWELLISAQATGPPIRGPTPHPSEERMAATYLAGPRRHPDHDHS